MMFRILNDRRNNRFLCGTAYFNRKSSNFLGIAAAELHDMTFQHKKTPLTTSDNYI